jgi:hypothetical protein
MWLCEVCAPFFEQQKNHGWVRGYDHSVLSLYTWTQARHRLNQRVIYSLKGAGPNELYFDSAVSMCSLRLSLGEPLINPIFVPSPRSNRLFEDDHAESFCKALANVLGAPQLQALKRKSQSVHRRKSRLERQLTAQARFELNNKSSIEILQKQMGTVVFVDDLITTGSTARAAWQILGRPSRFEVWTLMNKPVGSC